MSTAMRSMRLGDDFTPIEQPDFNAVSFAATAAPAGTGQYDNWMVMTDDSYWEPNVDYAALAAAGVGSFLIRSGGPTSWNEGYYNAKVDREWFRKFRLARATGNSVGGYWVHNAGEMIQDYRDPRAQIEQMKEAWYGEFVPDYLVLDVEVNYFYRNGNMITVPAPNYVRSVETMLEAMWKEWRKTVYLYTSVTHMKKAGAVEFLEMLDRLNGKSLADVRFPLHLACYPTVCQKAFELTSVDQLKAIIPPLSSFKQYLTYGNTSVDSRIWQCSSAIKHKGASLDWNVVPFTRDQWEAYIGFKRTPTTPPPTDPGPTPGETEGPDLAELRSMVEALTGRVTELERWRKS